MARRGRPRSRAAEVIHPEPPTRARDRGGGAISANFRPGPARRPDDNERRLGLSAPARTRSLVGSRST